MDYRIGFPLRSVYGAIQGPRGVSATIEWMTGFLFVLLLAEGVARKWIAPNHHQIFYFLRDPFLLILYAFAFTKVPRLPAWFWVWGGAALFLSVSSFLVYHAEGKPMLVWLLGVRNYFAYVPLAFIVGVFLDREGIRRILTVVALFAPVVAWVQVLQFYSTPGSWINVGAGGAVPPALALGFLRTTGLLASDAQQVSYILFTLAACTAGYLGAVRKKEKAIFAIGIASALTMMIVSGSRAVWILGATILLGLIGCAVIARIDTQVRLRMVAAGVLVVVLVPWLFSSIFEDALQAYQERNEAARTFSEATVERIESILIPKWMLNASLVGEGVGIAMTGAAAVMSGERALTLAEGDLDRNFAELGVIGGSVFVGLRIVFSFWLFGLGVSAARRGNPIVLVLVSFATPAILATQITMHTVYAHLAWMAAGLAMAAARSSDGRQVLTEGPPAPSLARASLRLAALRSRGLRLSARRVSL